MIQDYQTNMVYLAEGLKYYKPVYTNLLKALEKEGIPYRFLPSTQSKKHIWVRDYKPIQLEKDKFLAHKYYPNYLIGFEDYIPDYDAIVKDLNLNCIETSFKMDGVDLMKCGNEVFMTNKTDMANMDGGNVVKCGKKVIMTNKIIDGNLIFPEERHDCRRLRQDSVCPHTTVGERGSAHPLRRRCEPHSKSLPKCQEHTGNLHPSHSEGTC